MARSDKIVQIVSLNQTTLEPNGSYLTLQSPSSSLEISSSSADTTVFGSGQFSQSLPTIFMHSMSGSQWIRSVAGYNCDVKLGGDPIAFTGEAMSLVSGTTYRITDATKNYFDPNTDVAVFDGATPLTAGEDYTVNHLFGEVTLNVAPSDAVTVDGASIPTTVFGSFTSASVTHSAASSDITTFRSAQADNGFASYRSELLTVDLEAAGFYSEADNTLDVMKDRDNLLLEIDWTGEGDLVSRGIFRVSTISQDGDVGSTENASVSFTISGPEDVIPYGFQFSANSVASESFQLVLNTWINGEYLGFRYAPDGLDATYYDGVACITDASMSTSTEGITEMSIEFQGHKELEEVVPVT